MENVPNWDEAIENVTIPNEILVLENSIHQHQNLYELMCQAYTEVNYKFIYLYPLQNLNFRDQYRCIMRIKAS